MKVIDSIPVNKTVSREKGFYPSPSFRGELVKIGRDLTKNFEAPSSPNMPSNRGHNSPSKVTTKGTIKFTSKPSAIAQMGKEGLAQTQPGEHNISQQTFAQRHCQRR